MHRIGDVLMTTPGPPIVTPPTPPTPVPAPTVPGDAASIRAWTLYQQQLKEFQNPRPVPVVPVPPSFQGQPSSPPITSFHPDWVNPCAECGVAATFPCVGPNGLPIGFIHAPRIMLKPPANPPQPFTEVLPPGLNKGPNT